MPGEEHVRPDTLTEYLDQFDGELDSVGLLQDLYRRDDVTIPWTTYILPDDTSKGKVVRDTFRQYKDDLSMTELGTLKMLVQGERNRRRAELRRQEDGVECVLCDETSETPEDHNRHMEEVHDC